MSNFKTVGTNYTIKKQNTENFRAVTNDVESTCSVWIFLF